MDKFAKLMQDIGILWEKYRMMYLNGMLNTLGLALAATAIGCVIGLLCGILNTIPCAKNDPLPKRILLKLLRVIIRIYVEVFRGTPMMEMTSPFFTLKSMSRSTSGSIASARAMATRCF